jgi:23S rRNA pseudouridine2605 synthase
MWSSPTGVRKGRAAGRLAQAVAPEAASERLQKALASAGLGSRREMEAWIAEGRVQVNGETATIGMKVGPRDIVKVSGRRIYLRFDEKRTRILIYHKSEGEIVTRDDPQGRATVFDALPKLRGAKWISIGRLDYNTDGLMIFTTDGELANKLMHPRFGLQREYAVRVLGALSNDEKDRLLEGVRLDDGMAQFQSIEDGGGDGANCWYRVTIAEGRNREVRRMFEAVGHAVSRLIRIRYGAVMLPRGLRRGVWMELDHRDIERLTSAAGMVTPSEAAAARPARPAPRNPSRRKGQGPRPSAPKARTPTGARRPVGPSSPMPGTKASGLRKRMNGTVERRP